MPRLRVNISTDLAPLRHFGKEVRNGLRGMPGPIDDLFKLIGQAYLSFAQRRYNRFSRGGGDWPPLKAATIKRRRRGPRKKSATAILRDTGTLFNALGRGSPGNVFKRTRRGILVGIGGGATHPDDKKLTVGKLAEYHNFGMGKNPKREIVPEELDPQARAVIQLGVQKAAARLAARSRFASNPTRRRGIR